MNGNDVFDPQCSKQEIVEVGSTTPRIVLHRLAAVRRAKGVPRRVLAQRLGMSVRELRVEEESADLSIGTLCHWASVLNVPITELVNEPDECVAPAHLARSQATRLMTLAARLRDRARRRDIKRLAQTFVEQLTEILPTLEQLARKDHRRPPRPSPTGTLRPLPTNVFMLRREPGDR